MCERVFKAMEVSSAVEKEHGLVVGLGDDLRREAVLHREGVVEHVGQRQLLTMASANLQLQLLYQDNWDLLNPKV